MHILDIRPKKKIFPVTRPTHSVYNRVDFKKKAISEKIPILYELNFLLSGNSNFVKTTFFYFPERAPRRCFIAVDRQQNDDKHVMLNVQHLSFLK
jgi:hypothetical protein